MVLVLAAAFAVMLAGIYRMVTESMRDLDLVQSKRQAIIRKGRLCAREAETAAARIEETKVRIAERQRELEELKREVDALGREVQNQEEKQQGRHPTRDKLSTV